MNSWKISSRTDQSGDRIASENACQKQYDVRFTDQREMFQLRCTARRWRSWKYSTRPHVNTVPTHQDTSNSILPHSSFYSYALLFTRTWLRYVTCLCYRKSVCPSYVTFVRPTQGVKTSGNISSPVCTLTLDLRATFYGYRPTEPVRRGGG